MNHEETLQNLKDREEYLDGERYQLYGLIEGQEAGSQNWKDLVTAVQSVGKALRAIRRAIAREEKEAER